MDRENTEDISSSESYDGLYQPNLQIQNNPQSIKKRRFDSNESDAKNQNYSDSNHVAEHVSELKNNFFMRKEHWKECILKTQLDELADLCAQGELTDCLSTVNLTCATIPWLHTQTYDTREALKQGISSQLPIPENIWGKMAEEQHLESLLTNDIERHHPLEKTYQVSKYSTAALSRLKAVHLIAGHFTPADKQELKKVNPLFKLVIEKITNLTNDPRAEMIETVALYHWFLKTDLTNFEPTALV